MAAGRIDVIGLGPAGPAHVTAGALDLVAAADAVFLRTARHPSVRAVTELRPEASSFDRLYEESADFESLYEQMAELLLEAAAGARVVYAVPGSPSVAEASVLALRERAPARGVDLVVHPAVSYLDLAFDRLGLDPAGAGLLLLDAASFKTAAAGLPGPFLVSQVWSRHLLSELKLSLEEPVGSERAVILHHLGLDDEAVVEVSWEELDRTIAPDHLTSVFVPTLARPPAAELAALAETVATLRRLCPWDRRQDHRSLARHLLEETYEALDAIDGLGEEPSEAPPAAVAHLVEELGDVLCQVVFHSVIAEEEGLFTLAEVARGIDDKLVERHPHVFGAGAAPEHVLSNWEAAKDARLGRRHLFEGIPAALPALARAEKFERKLAGAGLAGGEAAADLDDEGLGQALFLLARRGAAAGLDPEGALRRRLERLSAAVAALEEAAAAGGRSLAEQAALTQSQPPLW